MRDKQDSAKVTTPKQARDDARQERETVRQAADVYRAALMAAAPPQPEKPAQSETQKRRSSQRLW